MMNYNHIKIKKKILLNSEVSFNLNLQSLSDKIKFPMNCPKIINFVFKFAYRPCD